MSYYSQRDVRWSSEIMGFGVSTIGSVGCYLTSLCNGLNMKGYSYTPFTLNALLKENGLFTGDFKNYIDVENIALKLPAIFSGFHRVDNWNTSPSLDEIVRDDLVALGQVSGKPIGGSSTHFVLITGKSRKTAIIHDPWSDIEEKITVRWGKYGNILGLRLFKVNPFTTPESPNEEKLDFERATEKLKAYRPIRKRNGVLAPEGNWEGYVNAIIGSDKDIDNIKEQLKSKPVKIEPQFNKPIAKALYNFAKMLEGNPNVN